MRNFILKNIIKRFVLFFKSFDFGAYILDYVLKVLMESRYKVIHNKIEFYFATPNRLCEYRAKSFSSKEPETLQWIDSFTADSVFWDIGANVGLYSIYAAKTKNIQIFSFEPSIFNVELLARNINLNNVQDKICIVPLPISDVMQFSTMNMSSTEWGGALSSFGRDIGWDGNKMLVVFKYQILGSTIDDMVEKNKLPIPDYVKIDVDGIEHFILNGGLSVLKNIKELLIEVNDGFLEQAKMCEKVLLSVGLTMREKRHSEEFDQVGAFGGGQVWNQIWYRV